MIVFQLEIALTGTTVSSYLAPSGETTVGAARLWFLGRKQTFVCIKMQLKILRWLRNCLNVVGKRVGTVEIRNASL